MERYAILCRDHATMDTCARALQQRGLPRQVRKRSGDYRSQRDRITVMTMQASKGLEFALVSRLTPTSPRKRARVPHRNAALGRYGYAGSHGRAHASQSH